STTSSWRSCSPRARVSRTRTCSATRWRSPACPSTRPASSAPYWPGWRGRTRPRRRWVNASRRDAAPAREARIMSDEAVQMDEAVAADGTAPPADGAARAPETEDVLEAMRDVVDPELGVNVVDLGLVYGVTLGGGGGATTDMTLTSAAGALTDVIEEQAASALEGLVTDFRINWVWLPPWGPDKITEDGREQLRALGFNV